MPRPINVPADVTPDELADILRTLPNPGVLVCRDRRHHWDEYDGRRLGPRLFERTLYCANCDSYRYQYLNERGKVLNSWIDYGEHYLIKGAGRLDSDQRDAVRVVTVIDSLLHRRPVTDDPELTVAEARRGRSNRNPVAAEVR
jgi:hypothetical protein